jgi:hypothetical protein
MTRLKKENQEKLGAILAQLRQLKRAKPNGASDDLKKRRFQQSRVDLEDAMEKIDLAMQTNCEAPMVL